MTTDQDHPRLSETITSCQDISSGLESSRQAKEHALRARLLRDGGGTAPADTRRTGVWSRGLTVGESVPRPSGHVNAQATGGESPIAQLLSIAHEDIARLTDVLRDQRCEATLRGMDGMALPIAPSKRHPPGKVHGDALEGTRSHGSTPTLSASIYDAEGRTLAFLDLSLGDLARSESSESLLRALIDSTARAMTERWFRLTHRRLWIVAALSRRVPHVGMLLAVDRDQRLVAADRGARQLLEQKGRRFEKHQALSLFFQSVPALLRRRGYADAPITLRGSSDGEQWIALVTAPDMGAIVSDHDARALLHIRPRGDSLMRLLWVESDVKERHGLSHGALKRVQEHVDANIDSSLEIDVLAGLLRMSVSHFTRSFNRSVGLTPHRYVIQCRVAKARELLTTTDLPLIEIALNIGFSDQSHFSRRFQELVGMPPGAYRRVGDSGLPR
jgi:AraC-like DNA-binding protein